MSTYQFANNATSTLASSVAAADTTITLASGTGAKFPNPAPGQYFTATLFTSATGVPNEIVLVTARTGDTLTCVRGQEGTTAQAWAVGASIDNFVTAGFLNQLIDGGTLAAQAGFYAADGGTANAGAVTLTPVPASLSALVGTPIRVKKMGQTNTGAYTLNVNNLGSQAVLLGGVQLEGGELTGNEIFMVVFDGGAFNLLSAPGIVHGDRLAGSSVANAALAEMASLTIKGNLSGGEAQPYDIPLADLINALGLSGAWEDGFFDLGDIRVQFGENRTVTNSTSSVYTQAYNAPFAANTVAVVVFVRWDAPTGSYRAYNQKTYTQYGDGDNNGFPWRLHDTDSSDPSSYVYGFNWIAIGKKP